MTDYFRTTHQFVFRNVPADVLDEWTDAVASELESTGVRDLSVGGSLTDGYVDFEFYLPAAAADEVAASAIGRMRSALATVGTLGTHHSASVIAEETMTVIHEPATLSA